MAVNVAFVVLIINVFFEKYGYGQLLSPTPK